MLHACFHQIETMKVEKCDTPRQTLRAFLNQLLRGTAEYQILSLWMLIYEVA